MERRRKSPSRRGTGRDGDRPDAPHPQRFSTEDPGCEETTLAGLTEEVTPTSSFFLRSHFAIPQLRLADWRLRVTGSVDRPLDVSYADLLATPQRRLTAVLECAGNSRSGFHPPAEGVRWGHGAVGAARWDGVPLREILGRAGVRPAAREVVLEGADRGREPGAPAELAFEMSIPIEKALDPGTLLATQMNGEPLTPGHGFPVRAVVPGWYGMASVKWIVGIRLIDRPFDGHFRTVSYAFVPNRSPVTQVAIPATAIRAKSLLLSPADGATLRTGDHVLRGVAWSGGSPLERVEVAVREPTAGAGVRPGWRRANLSGEPTRTSWSHWSLPVRWDRVGRYEIRVRATAVNGEAQPDRADWNLRGLGNNSVHVVAIQVGDSDP